MVIAILLALAGAVGLGWVALHRPSATATSAFRSAYTRVAASIDAHLPRADLARQHREQTVLTSEINALAAAFDRFDADLKAIDFGPQADLASAVQSATVRVNSDLHQLAAAPAATNANALTDDLQLWDQTNVALAAALGVVLPTSAPLGTPAATP
ncbi:MAG: hypothetical protein ACR2GX_05995 [Candidatus Dormibacteria bacterium]